MDATLGALQPGYRLMAYFDSPPGTPLDQVLASPAIGVAASTSEPSEPPRPPEPHSAFKGRVVSVDTTAGTITADLGQLASHEGTRDAAGSSTPQLVTIKTDSNTKFRLDGAAATLGALAAGDEFVAYYAVFAGETLDQILASPAVGIAAHTTRAFYGFAGTVTGVDATASTVTINVLASSPAAGGLLGQVTSATLKVGPQTFLVGKGGLLSDLVSVHVGDLAAGGLVTTPAASLADVLAQPLDVLVDVPASAIPAGAMVRAARRTLARVRDRAAGAHGNTPHHPKHHSRSAAFKRHGGRTGRH